MASPHPKPLYWEAYSRPASPDTITSPPTQHKLPRLPRLCPAPPPSQEHEVTPWFTPRLAFLSETLSPGLHLVGFGRDLCKQAWTQTCLLPFPLVGSRMSPDPFHNPAISHVYADKHYYLFILWIPGKNGEKLTQTFWVSWRPVG